LLLFQNTKHSYSYGTGSQVGYKWKPQYNDCLLDKYLNFILINNFLYMLLVIIYILNVTVAITHDIVVHKNVAAIHVAIVQILFA